MKKTKIRIFSALLMTVLCMTAFSTTAFAGGGEDYTEPTPATEPKEETPPVPLTPEGNLTLVDDVEQTDEIDKQFITAVSKNGNYFYLVIDRAGKEDNVYLLNMVDEADLMALMEDGTASPKVCSCTDKCEVGAVNADCSVCSEDKSKCTGKAAEATEPAEPQPEKEKGSPMGIAVLLLVFSLVGGGTFYYFKVVKNKVKPQSNPNMNEYDFSDDEDDEDEYGYEPTSEEQEDAPEESEDDVK
ncbi:DUF4366 domain-containing protein [Listeria monocytogenes]|nr:DUF4366 domain-containing protein [Listeria monocytogenes]EAG9407335.1 DUF4366 domain-containing protein [Listeria monocytogenes]EEP2907160.1 DUF4366 domain-containing protein [Listeria monocytogenes]EEP2907606.1 DUF4366 domain-containing protein [Listeria monocytogenes]EEP6699438.1 DUF4366 domain-containing protein [Listeria monocytogenes]